MAKPTDQDLLDSILTDRRGLINWDRFLNSIKSNGLDAVVAASPINVTYSGGMLLETFKHYWFLTYVVTTADGKQGVVINEGDAGFFREYSWISDVRTFRYVAKTEDGNRQGMNLMADIAHDLGVHRGTLGIEKAHLPASSWDDMKRALPNATLVDCGNVFRHARLIKTPEEIAVMKKATGYTERAIRLSIMSSKPGDSEKDLSSRIQGKMLQSGADALGTWTDLQTGCNSLIPHSWPTRTRMGMGETVHIDAGAFFGGYITGLACNAAVGQTKEESAGIFKRIWEIKRMIIEKSKPGLGAAEIFELAEAAYSRSGLTNPWDSVGYGIGLQKHEGFEITEGSDEVLQQGMVLNFALNHIEPEDARYHIEETVVVTSDRVEALSTLTESSDIYLIV